MTKKEEETKKAEYNPRWRGYVFIALASLVNFCSISTAKQQRDLSSWAGSLVFGLFTFTLALLILLQDRSQKLCLQNFNFTNAKNGLGEGLTLLAINVWWIVGVGYQTKVGGIAYVANNIYYSSWASLLSCACTLNEWSAAKDILSWEELTSLSLTLKSWYACLLSSLVVLFTCVDMYIFVDVNQLRNLDDSSFGIALGVVSSIISIFFILVHYEFFSSQNLQEGGWLELSSSFFLILLWTIGLAVMTQDGGIAATLSGNSSFHSKDTVETIIYQPDCAVLFYETLKNGTLVQVEKSCLELADLSSRVPGSNLYFAAWICFFSSFNVTFRWKAAQALQFAQAQQQIQQQGIPTNKNIYSDEADDDDDEDDDE